MVTFWTWFVRNPAFLAAALALGAGIAGIAEWAIAMPLTAAGAVVGDAAAHLARKARVRTARRLAELAAASSNVEAMRRFTDYQHVERDAA